MVICMKKRTLLFCSIYCLLYTVNGNHRRHSSEDGKDPMSMVQIEHNDKGLIDLDDTTFDVALEHYPKPVNKNGEDMREVSYGGEGMGEVDDNTDVQVNEGGQVKPNSMMSELLVGSGNIYSTNTTSDDEDFASGSGSGDFLIEDATGKYINTSEDSSEAVEGEHLPAPLPPYCEENINVTWAPWSPWIQLGDHDVRFRRCLDDNKMKVNSYSCHGDYFERRPCAQKKASECRLTDGSVTEQFHVRCHGVDLDDIENAEALRDPLDRKEDCMYSLYDMKYKMQIGNPITTEELQHADRKLWCAADDSFISFHTPKQRCLENLRAFCKMTDICKYDRLDDEKRSKTFSKQTCWKDFVLGGILPTGIPVYKSQQMICQHFDRESKFGQVFGHKNNHFVTLYDTKRRLPLVSMVTVRSLGDEKWPNVPFMIERGLVEETGSNIISWFFHNKKKGIVNPRELTKQCDIPICEFGKKQSLPSDFDHSGYKMMPLLSPDLIGSDLGQKVATFTTTNIVPMKTTVYSAWKRTNQIIRDFAIDTCKIPTELPNSETANHRRDGHDFPELYLLSGSVAPLNHMEVIGNDVIVPEIIWTAACCAHGAEVSSFGIYTYNQYGQTPAIVSIENLQVLLQSMYFDNVDKIKIELFPAFASLCSATENDVSLDLAIP